MSEFSVYHLDHLNHKNRALINKILKSNRTLDESILRQYTSNRYYELLVRDQNIEITSSTFIKDKCAAVLEALELGLYKHIANVKASNIVEAIKLTTSINKYWFMKKSNNLEFVGLSERDTSTYDLIVYESKFYLINSLGFIDLQNKAIAKF
ncbi:hypothetical protein [Pseudoalteromonas prydzensis]|uniref:hypothetical protein n=1 Tax=Pseudoalteromonas prydzensis TaxID=182141 RepID=UPI003FD51E39